MQQFSRQSTRTKVLIWLYLGILAVGVGFVFALLISLAEYFIADWEDAPVNEVIGWMVRWVIAAIVPLAALRMAVAWSAKSDRRA